MVCERFIFEAAQGMYLHIERLRDRSGFEIAQVNEFAAAKQNLAFLSDRRWRRENSSVQEL